MDFAAANYSLFCEKRTAPAALSPARSSDLYFWFTGLLTPRNTVNNRPGAIATFPSTPGAPPRSMRAATGNFTFSVDSSR